MEIYDLDNCLIFNPKPIEFFQRNLVVCDNPPRSCFSPFEIKIPLTEQRQTRTSVSSLVRLSNLFGSTYALWNFFIKVMSFICNGKFLHSVIKIVHLEILRK